MLALEPPAAMVVRHMELGFLKPAVIDDLLVVKSAIESLRGARMIMNQSITRDGEILATAHLEAALITLGGGPRRFPSTVLAKLEPWVQAP
jgi:acyl-CoA thioester hydrolase